MTNDLKNFLEEEKQIDYQLFCFDKEDESWSINEEFWFYEERLKERDTRLINFVLDLVEKEVEKKLLKKARQTDYADRTEYDEASEIISTIINKLRV